MKKVFQYQLVSRLQQRGVSKSVAESVVKILVAEFRSVSRQSSGAIYLQGVGSFNVRISK